MKSTTMEVWISRRQPPVPTGFQDRMRPEIPDAPAGVESLSHEAVAALRRALSGDPSRREAAFHLLAADGFATWACEAALEGEAPDVALDAIVDLLLA